MRNNAVLMFVVVGAFLSACDNSTPTNSNPKFSYDSIQDVRDGYTYKTIGIGTQTWMAENLNYAGSGSDSVGLCYAGSVDSCKKFGRLYTWSEANAFPLAFDTLAKAVVLPNQGICPNGWHVPSVGEWNVLFAFVGYENNATVLKSTTDWLGDYNSGTDQYGFHALPSGWHDVKAGFVENSYYAAFWDSNRPLGASDDSVRLGWHQSFDKGFRYVTDRSDSKATGASLRCIKN